MVPQSFGARQGRKSELRQARDLGEAQAVEADVGIDARRFGTRFGLRRRRRRMPVAQLVQQRTLLREQQDDRQED